MTVASAVLEDVRSVPLWRDRSEVPAEFGPCVATIGVFDGVHQGHRRLIGRACEIGRRQGRPVVLVTFDPHPARVLGLGRDTATLTGVVRRTELAAEAGVDAVCVLRFTPSLAARSPAEFVRDVLVDRLQVSAVVVGVNFTFGARGSGSVETLRDLGGEHGFTAHGVPLLGAVDAPCSSTYVRRCIRNGDLDAAARALGRPHLVDGRCSGSAVLLAENTALPPAGRYQGLVNGRIGQVEVESTGGLTLLDESQDMPGDTAVSVVFLRRV